MRACVPACLCVCVRERERWGERGGGLFEGRKKNESGFVRVSLLNFMSDVRLQSPPQLISAHPPPTSPGIGNSVYFAHGSRSLDKKIQVTVKTKKACVSLKQSESNTRRNDGSPALPFRATTQAMEFLLKTDQ